MWLDAEASCRILCAVRWMVGEFGLHTTALSTCSLFHYFLNAFLGVDGREHVVTADSN